MSIRGIIPRPAGLPGTQLTSGGTGVGASGSDPVDAFSMDAQAAGGPLAADAFLHTQNFDHGGRQLRFHDLEAFVGVLSMGMRADTSRAHRVGMDSRFDAILGGDGIDDLYAALVRKGIKPVPIRLAPDISQTDDPNRSIVELVSNALDAGSPTVDIKLTNGGFGLADTGSGMDAFTIAVKLLLPKISGKVGEQRKVGRFGIGFYTALRHLKHDGEHVELMSATDGGPAYRLIFRMERGRIRFHSERVEGEDEDALAGGGTHVQVKARDISARTMRAEIKKYLRLVNDGRKVLVNGKQINRFDYPPHDRMNAEGDLGRVYRDGSGPGLVTVKVGEVIIEWCELRGNVPGGEMLIELPHASELSITRDALAVDGKVHGYMQALAARATTIAEANGLAPLFEALDKRHEFAPLMDSLRQRVGEIATGAAGEAMIYPDDASLRAALQGNAQAIFVHPSLYNPAWLERFAMPAEFMSGTVFSAGGWERPLKVVLTGDLAAPAYLDKGAGVLYLNEAIYRARPAFVFSALALVRGMDFRMQWRAGDAAVRGGMLFAKKGQVGEAFAHDDAQAEVRPARTAETVAHVPALAIPGANIAAIEDFVARFGYKLADFALQMDGYPKVEQAGGRAWIRVQDGRSWKLYNDRGVPVYDQGTQMPIEGDWIEITKAGGRTWIVVQDGGRRKLYNDQGVPVCHHGTQTQIEGDGIGMMEAGGWTLMLVRDGGRSKLYDAQGAPVCQQGTQIQIEGDWIEIIEAGERVWIVVQDGERDKIYDDRGVPVYDQGTQMPIEGDRIEIREAGGRTWIVVQDGGRRKLYDVRGAPVCYQNTQTQIEGYGIGMIEAGGRAWIEVRDGGRRKLYDAKGAPVCYHGTQTQIEGDGIEIREAGGRAWIMVQDDGRLKLYDDQGAPVCHHGTQTQIEGRWIIIPGAGGRTWIVVQDGERHKIYDDRGVPVYDQGTQMPIEGDWIEIREAGGREWIRVVDDGRLGLYDDRGVPVYDQGAQMPIEGDGIEIREAGGRVWIRVQDGRRKKLYDDAGREFPCYDFFDTPSGIIAAKGEGVLRLCDLDRLLTEPRIAARFQVVGRHRIDAPSVQYALFNADDGTWERFINDPRLRYLLPRIRTREGLAYAAAHADDNPADLSNALAIMEKMPARGIEEDIYVERIAAIMHSGMDIGEVVDDLIQGRETHDIKALREYLGSADSVVPGKSHIAAPAGREVSLADAITHLRLHREGARIEQAMDAVEYRSEEDRRLVVHAIHHLHAIHPHVYLRELLQNSLDIQSVPGRVAEGAHRIETDTFIERGDLVLRMRDYGGMTEDELIDLLLPGEGSKGVGVWRGGFSMGFFATMAGAKWVRLKTAVAGARHATVLDFRVIRDESGRIADIRLRMEKVANDGGFTGTVVETARYAEVPLLAAAHIKTRLQDVGQYVSGHEAMVSVNGSVVNAGRNGALVEFDDAELGRVELYDGLANALLLGNLPLAELPEKLWQVLPAGIRDYYARKGFYINLDHAVLKPTPTRDRLRDHGRVLERLGAIIPGLLIQGFLKRVASAEHPEDMHELPEVYFVEAYRMAAEESLGSKVMRDSELINSERYAEIEMERYADPDTGRQNLAALLTLVKFIRVEGEDEPLSLRDVHNAYLLACEGYEPARALCEKIRASATLPASIREKISYADVIRTVDKENRRLAEEHADDVVDYRPNETYDLSQINDDNYRRYLKMLEEVTAAVFRHFGGGAVTVGINTREDHAMMFAYHYRRGDSYHLYRSFGLALAADVQEYVAIRSMRDRTMASRSFKDFLTRMYEVVTHELTHVLREHPVTITHTGKFYADQIQLMLEAAIARGQDDRWFDEFVLPE